MWWHRVVLLCCLTLSACGYRPLYGDPGPGELGTPAVLAAISVQPIPDRTGQVLYNFLIDRLSPQGSPVAPLYRLTVALSATEENLGLRQDETATRANLILRAAYTLTRVKDGEILMKASSRSISSYDILENPFGALVSEEDAYERAARDLSEDIRTRLAIFFSDAVARAP